MKYLFWLTFFLPFFGCSHSNTTIIIVPNDYVGPIVILYDQKSSSSQNNYRYILPKTGVIRTSDEDAFGKFDFSTFYLDTISRLTKLNRVLDFDQVPKLGKVVYGGQSHYAIKSGQNGTPVKYISYCVGNRSQIEKCYKEVERTDYTITGL